MIVSRHKKSCELKILRLGILQSKMARRLPANLKADVEACEKSDDRVMRAAGGIINDEYDLDINLAMRRTKDEG